MHKLRLTNFRFLPLNRLMVYTTNQTGSNIICLIKIFVKMLFPYVISSCYYCCCRCCSNVINNAIPGIFHSYRFLWLLFLCLRFEDEIKWNLHTHTQFKLVFEQTMITMTSYLFFLNWIECAFILLYTHVRFKWPWSEKNIQKNLCFFALARAF